MRVILILSNEMSIRSSNPSKRKMSGVISRLRKDMGSLSGSCRVTYGKGYENSFDFESEADLKYKLWPCIEQDTIKEFSK